MKVDTARYFRGSMTKEEMVNRDFSAWTPTDEWEEWDEDEWWCPREQRWGWCPGPCPDGRAHEPERTRHIRARVWVRRR